MRVGPLRVTEINHNTIINWVREVGLSLPDAPEVDEIPEVTELDELQTNVCAKKNKVWLWTAVNKKTAGILAWVVGKRSSDTFEILWSIVQDWQSFWYATDGYSVYAKFIDEISHIVSKTYMTRVEGENTRVRHKVLRSLTPQDFMLFTASEEMLEVSLRLLLHYLKYWTIPLPA